MYNYQLCQDHEERRAEEVNPAELRFFERYRRGEARDSAGGWFINTPGRGKSPASLFFLSGGTSPVHLPVEGKRGKLRWRV